MLTGEHLSLPVFFFKHLSRLYICECDLNTSVSVTADYSFEGAMSRPFNPTFGQHWLYLYSKTLLSFMNLHNIYYCLKVLKPDTLKSF